MKLPIETYGKWETDLRVVKLFDVSPTALIGRNLLHSNDLDRVGSGPMSGPHISVTRGDGIGHRNVSIFSVHVMGAGTGIVSEPHAVVLDPLCGFVFLDFSDLHYLSVRFLYFT